MRKSSVIHTALALASVMSVNPTYTPMIVPFNIGDESKAPLRDENGEIILENGQPIYEEAKPLGVVLRQAGQAQIPTFPFMVAFEASQYPGTTAQSHGTLQKGVTAKVHCLDLDLESNPEFGNMELSELQEKMSGLNLQQMKDAGYLKLKNDDEREYVPEFVFFGMSAEEKELFVPAPSMDWRVFLGRRSRPGSYGVKNQDYITYIPHGSVPLRENSTGTNWQVLGKLERVLETIYSLSPFMEKSPATEALLEMFKPQSKGGWLPFTADAPSQQQASATTGNGLPTGNQVVSGEVPEDPNALSAMIPEDDGGQFDDDTAGTVSEEDPTGTVSEGDLTVTTGTGTD